MESLGRWDPLGMQETTQVSVGPHRATLPPSVRRPAQQQTASLIQHPPNLGHLGTNDGESRAPQPIRGLCLRPSSGHLSPLSSTTSPSPQPAPVSATHTCHGTPQFRAL